MPSFTDQFLDEENFFIAFKKISSFLNKANEWYDPVGLVKYEAGLSERIPMLIAEIKAGNYTPRPLQPLPFPKKDKENGEHRIRPYYVVHLDDQLISTAAVNIIGDILERKMPQWSYGNRLYRPVWYETNADTGKKTLKRGNCKNTSANLFRSWQQSWPRYKRHISMTITIMSKSDKFSVSDFNDPVEVRLFEQAQEDGFTDTRYLDQKSWQRKELKKLYWAGLDFKTFFPSINADKIIDNMVKYLVKDDGEPRDDVEIIIKVLSQLLSNKLDTTGWEASALSAYYNYHEKTALLYRGLPTGLLVAGFLANVALMDIDIELQKLIRERKDTAIFKYVDDHVVISQSKEALLETLGIYHLLLKEKQPTITFQSDKIEPKDGLSYNADIGFTVEDEKAIELDVEYPDPLMTNTLQKVSAIDRTDMDLLQKDELLSMEADLKHLFLTDLPGTEIRKDTKMSFAAGKICALARQIKPDFGKLDPFAPINQIILDKKTATLFDNYNGVKPDDGKGVSKLLITLRNIAAADIVSSNLPDAITEVKIRQERLFKLLLKALRENPDKVKLWRRCVEFCFITGYDGLSILLGEIEECSVHNLSRSYLYAYCLLNVQLYLERAFTDIQNRNGLFWKNHCSWLYITNVCALNIDPEYNKLNFPFRTTTINNLRSIAFFINDQCKSLPAILDSFSSFMARPETGSICSIANDTGSEIFAEQKYDHEDIVWYCISRITWSGKPAFIEKIGASLNLSSPLAWSILSVYPGSISGEQFLQIRQIISENSGKERSPQHQIIFAKDNALTLELLTSLKIKDVQVFEKFIDSYPKIKNVLNRREGQYIGLDKYIEHLANHPSKRGFIEVKLSEWSLIEIVRQVVVLTRAALKKREKGLRAMFTAPPVQHLYLHPTNYLVPESWLTSDVKDWASWKALVKKDKVKLSPLFQRLDDKRYFPVSNLWDLRAILFMGNYELPLVIGYSMLLIKLLSRSFEWPPAANKIVFIDQLFSQAHRILETESLSSNSRILLSAIFFKNKVDIFYNDIIELSDNANIHGLTDFITRLVNIQTALADQQMNLKDHQPRQLIYINLDDLEGPKDEFFKRI
ncbi:MAG: RNA-directed DNA polymerase [Bacteroidota bacterium]|nr:RNA-directed DNA polymerase [Bacteroidota bacterium]